LVEPLPSVAADVKTNPANRIGTLPGRKDSATLFETMAASFGIGAWLVGTTTTKEFAGRNVKHTH